MGVTNCFYDYDYDYEIASLDFVINRFFVKLFKPKNIEIVRVCQELFGFELPSTTAQTSFENFENRFYDKSVLIV